MSVLRLFATEFPLGVRLREIQVALTGWGLYVAVQAGYCLIHTKLVARAPFDLRSLVLWALGEWGTWLLITPLVFRTLRRYEDRSGKPVWVYAKPLACALAAALSIRMAIDYQTGTLGVAASLVIFLPRYAAALALVVLTWHLCLRKGSLAIAVAALPFERSSELTSPGVNAALRSPRESSPVLESSAAKSRQHEEPAVARPETLLVSNGRDECLIRVDGIQYISAAGNYVEICCDHQLYTLRATMKQVEALLPPDSFVRTHRSHIVRIDQIECIRARPSGNSMLTLRCGKILNVSKRYRAQLETVSARMRDASAAVEISR